MRALLRELRPTTLERRIDRGLEELVRPTRHGLGIKVDAELERDDGTPPSWRRCASR